MNHIVYNTKYICLQMCLIGSTILTEIRGCNNYNILLILLNSFLVILYIIKILKYLKNTSDMSIMTPLTELLQSYFCDIKRFFAFQLVD
jgi:hypothetical protein